MILKINVNFKSTSHVQHSLFYVIWCQLLQFRLYNAPNEDHPRLTILITTVFLAQPLAMHVGRAAQSNLTLVKMQGKTNILITDRGTGESLFNFRLHSTCVQRSVKSG